MTEVDATKTPLEMPERFIPYLEKYRLYQIFKDMVRDLVIHLPRDHLKHMKMYLNRYLHSSKDPDRVILLISPKLNIDTKGLMKQLIKDFGFIVLTRRFIMDRYEKHDDFEPGCISPVLMSEVVNHITMKDPVPQAGWMMFDHPCTVREARCLQQDGVLPTVTLVLSPTPPVAPPAETDFTPARNFFQQDFEGLKYAYQATLKEVYINSEDDVECISSKCFNAIRACASGAQGPGQGLHAGGAPGTYRVLLIGPRGSGRRSQAHALSKHFGIVYLFIDDLLLEAKNKNDDIGEKLRNFGPSVQMKAEIVRRRLMQKDCIDLGWVLTGYPTSGADFENLENMPISPNRIIFLKVEYATCKARSISVGIDWCSGKVVPRGGGAGGATVRAHPRNEEHQLDADLDFYFTEALAELRAAAGITAVEIDAHEPYDKVQVKLQAAVMSAPAFDIEFSHIQNACDD